MGFFEIYRNCLGSLRKSLSGESAICTFRTTHPRTEIVPNLIMQVGQRFVMPLLELHQTLLCQGGRSTLDRIQN